MTLACGGESWKGCPGVFVWWYEDGAGKLEVRRELGQRVQMGVQNTRRPGEHLRARAVPFGPVCFSVFIFPVNKLIPKQTQNSHSTQIVLP